MFKIRKRKHGGASSPNQAESFELLHRQLARSILYTARFFPQYQRMIESSKPKLSEAQLAIMGPILQLELRPSLEQLVAHALSYGLIKQDEARQLLDGKSIDLEATENENLARRHDGSGADD